MKTSTIVYRGILFIYNILPFKKIICQVLRTCIRRTDKFYKDFKFKGFFRVKSGDISFWLKHNNSTIENEIFWRGLGGSWEPETIWLWKILVKHSDIIFDIGANTGIYSLIAKAANTRAAVFAFEPALKTQIILSENIARNQYTVEIIGKAVSDNNEKRLFYDIKSDSQTSASLHKIMLSRGVHEDAIWSYEVDVITIDYIIQTNKISWPDLIKIDVEMHEPNVIKGMLETIQQGRPIIFIEILSDEIGERVATLFADLQYCFYKLYPGKIHQTDELVYREDCYNYLLCPENRISTMFNWIDTKM